MSCLWGDEKEHGIIEGRLVWELMWFSGACWENHPQQCDSTAAFCKGGELILYPHPFIHEALRTLGLWKRKSLQMVLQRLLLRIRQDVWLKLNIQSAEVNLLLPLSELLFLMLWSLRRECLCVELWQSSARDANPTFPGRGDALWLVLICID